MRQVCFNCTRTSSSGNLFCQDTACPAELSPFILEAGDSLGGVEVVRCIVRLPSASLYEATHRGAPVFLKMAHRGACHEQRLAREATFLASLLGGRRHPSLPCLRMLAYGRGSQPRAHDTALVNGVRVHYYLVEPFEGTPLPDLLTHRPWWWTAQVGALCIDLATTLNALHLMGVRHLALSPASILVSRHLPSSAPRLMVWDLGLVTRPQVADIATDVHAIGTVAAAMLFGEPGQMWVTDTLARATAHAMAARQPTAAQLAEEFIAAFGDQPAKSASPWPGSATLRLIAAATLLVALLIALAVVLDPL